MINNLIIEVMKLIIFFLTVYQLKVKKKYFKEIKIYLFNNIGVVF